VVGGLAGCGVLETAVGVCLVAQLAFMVNVELCFMVVWFGGFNVENVFRW
jgi:hypothetical protein